MPRHETGDDLFSHGDLVLFHAGGCITPERGISAATVNGM